MGGYAYCCQCSNKAEELINNDVGLPTVITEPVNYSFRISKNDYFLTGNLS